MAFRNPVRSLPASAITGQIVGTQIAANSIATEHLRVNALDGRVITGTLIRTAASGDRIELTPEGTLVMYSGADLETAPGELTTDIHHGGPGLTFGYLVLKAPRHATHEPPELVMQLGPAGDKRWSMGPLQLFEDGSSGATTVVGNGTVTGHLDVFGSLSAGNKQRGQVTITPVADTPTPVTITGLGLTAPITPKVTANSAAPGTQVKGLTVGAVSGSGFTIWLTRSNTTATLVYWEAEGA